MQTDSRFAAGLLRASARGYAVAAVERLRQQRPDLLQRLPRQFADPIDDTEVRLRILAEALAVDRPELFCNQIEWYRVALAHRDVPDDYLSENLRHCGGVLANELPAACRASAERHLTLARQRLPTAPRDLPCTLEADGPLVDEARRFLLALLENRGRDALAIIRNAHAAGASIEDLHDLVLTRVQRELGRMWSMVEIPIADEHYATRIVERAMDVLTDSMPPPPADGRRVLTLSVGGNQHDIGVRMVAERFELHGWQTLQLGADMPGTDLEWTLSDRSVDLVALSATLVLHVGAAEATIAQLRQGLGKRCPPILVGGQPFTVVPDLWTIIGADGCASDARTAVAVGERLVCGR